MTLLSNGVALTGSMVTLWLLVNYLGLSERGKVLFLQVTFTLVATFFRFGVQHNIQYYRKREQVEVLKKSLFLLIAKSILAYLFIVALFKSRTLLEYATLGQDDANILAAFSASTILYGASSYYVALLKRATQRAAQQIAHTAISVTALVLLVLNQGLSIDMFFVVATAANVVTFFINLLQIGLAPSFPKSITEILHNRIYSKI